MSSEDSPSDPPREFYIDTREALRSFVEEVSIEGLSSGECAVDTEADSMHSYETKLCLIQLAVPGSLAIVDPLAIGTERLGPLIDFLDRFETVWMHGADYDLSLFRKTFGWMPSRVWDTQVAARLLGIEKYGLANLLHDEFGLTVSKQSQKADWSRRPLKPKLLDYAYNDVRYLVEMGNRYLDRLREKERESWFVESCEAARLAVWERDEKPADSAWRVNGWGKLNRRGLLFLRELWFWRERECEKLNRPVFKFVSNQDLLRIAEACASGDSFALPKGLRPQYARRMEETVRQARSIPQEEYPVKRMRSTGPRLDIDERRFDRLKAHRNRVADQLGIDSTLIAPRQVLERLASPNFSGDDRDRLLLSWQKDLLAEALEAVAS